MKRITLLFLLGLFLLASVVPGCKKEEEVTNITYIFPVWQGSFETAPANPELGWAYYNTKLGQSFIYNGMSWQLMTENGKDGKDGKDGKNGVDGKDGQNGLGLVWKGELASAPSDAQTNWAYYNSSEKKSFIYDGTSWLVLAKDGAQGEKGADGQNGTNGTNNGTSAGFVWKGELEANPSEPQTNWAYYNKTDKKAYIYDGAKWSILAQDGKDGQNGNDGQPGTNGAPGTIIVWKGESATAPENPQVGWTYYNTAEKKSYMYANSAWQQIAQDGKDAEPAAEQVFAFTVNAEGKKVAFSSGNLQYNTANGGSYQFAAHQWDYIGAVDANNNCTGVFDLFCWGTGDNPAQKQVSVSSFTDWGDYIEPDKHWFTLTADEWNYIIGHSKKVIKTITISGADYKGLIILPDGCDKDIANTEWSELETAGAVFLPAAGYRNGGVLDCGNYARYWSATATLNDASKAQRLFFVSDVGVGSGARNTGISVRLVREVQ
jgi:hypothetical protein